MKRRGLVFSGLNDIRVFLALNWLNESKMDQGHFLTHSSVKKYLFSYSFKIHNYCIGKEDY